MEHSVYMKRAIEVSRLARESGNTPFGAVLVGPDGKIVMEQGNIEITEHRCTGHAETALVERASHVFDREFLWSSTLYTSVEPCAMCSGAIYWANVGTVVYGIEESTLLSMTGNDVQNPTFDLPCREVFDKGQKDIKVIGPLKEFEEEIKQVHEGYWLDK